MKYAWIGLSTLLTAGALACSSNEAAPPDTGDGEAVVLQGTVSHALHLDNARAVAIGRDGTTVSAYLDVEREFTLLLPVGQSYRVVVTNSLPDGGQTQVAHLVRSADGSTSEWFGANAGGTVDLGVLAGTGDSVTGLSPRSGRWMADDDGSGEDHADSGRHGKRRRGHDDDHACRRGGHAGPPPCKAGHDAELHPSSDPGERCKDKGGAAGGGADAGACTASDGGAGGGGGGGGGGGDGGAPTPDAGAGGGGSDPVGSECLTAATCASGLVCVAGLCSVPSGGPGSECLLPSECLSGVCTAGICQ